MGGIFISYRRDDAQGEALHLFDNLKQHFGVDRVFMDVIAIRPGEDYRKVIDTAVASCDVLITLIGRDWLTSATAAGQPRINDARDFVRLETAAALKRDVRVIPVLVHGATMPTEEALPDELKPLAYRNAVEVSHSRWDYDVRLLIEALERVVTAAAPAPGPPPSTTPTPLTARRSIPRMAAVGAVVAVLIGGAGYWFWPTPPASISVPRLVGLKEADARGATERAGLGLSIRASVKRGDAEPGTVVSQDPEAGQSVEKGRNVAIDVAAADLRSVPDLTGKSTHDATQALQQADLKWVFHREATDDTKANAVIRQQPASGTQVKPGTTVDVTVAVPATVEVPKLTGLAKGDALSALERASLKPRVSERPDAGEKPDMVIGQDPAAGTRAKPGSVIEVRVAVADLRTVPDLVGKPQREVVELVRKADLRLKAVKEPTSKYEVGTVLRQEPSAGARVSPGTEVTMFIATGMPPPPSEVPKVTGLPLDEAGARLWRMAGLAVKWDTEATRQYKQGVVTAQNPEAGARVKAGSEVTLTVAVTPNTCIPGYIWREAFPDDRVCVNPQIRAGAVDDNRSARSRLEPDPSKRDSGPDTCIKGLVWREAGPKDHVCVAPIVRTRAAEDNKQAAARVAR